MSEDDISVSRQSEIFSARVGGTLDPHTDRSPLAADCGPERANSVFCFLQTLIAVGYSIEKVEYVVEDTASTIHNPEREVVPRSLMS